MSARAGGRVTSAEREPTFAQGSDESNGMSPGVALLDREAGCRAASVEIAVSQSAPFQHMFV